MTAARRRGRGTGQRLVPRSQVGSPRADRRIVASRSWPQSADCAGGASYRALGSQAARDRGGRAGEPKTAHCGLSAGKKQRARGPLPDGNRESSARAAWRGARPQSTRLPKRRAGQRSPIAFAGRRGQRHQATRPAPSDSAASRGSPGSRSARPAPPVGVRRTAAARRSAPPTPPESTVSAPRRAPPIRIRRAAAQHGQHRLSQRGQRPFTATRRSAATHRPAATHRSAGPVSGCR